MTLQMLNKCAAIQGRWAQSVPPRLACSPASIRLTASSKHLAKGQVTVHATQEKSKSIENLSTDYCDSFECTSSPAVELTVRTLAKDLERCRYSSKYLDKSIKYEDGFRSASGPERVTWQKWIIENVQQPKVAIKRLQMLDKGTAQIDWNLKGQLNGNALDIDFKTVIEMNLLTGRITNLKETWDLKRLPPQAAVVITGSRVTYSAKLASREAGEKLATLSDSIASSLSMDDDDGKIYKDPADPTKFFQQNNNPMNDYITYGLFVALLYLVYRGFSEIAKL